MYDSDIDLTSLTLKDPVVSGHNHSRRRRENPTETPFTRESKNEKRESVLQQFQKSAFGAVSNTPRERYGFKSRHDSELNASRDLARQGMNKRGRGARRPELSGGRIRRYASEANIATEGSNSLLVENKYPAGFGGQRQVGRGRRNSGHLTQPDGVAPFLRGGDEESSEKKGYSSRGGRSRSRGPRNEGGQQRSQRIAFMGYKRLSELSQMDCERTLCMTLISDASGFSQLLNSDYIKPDWMALLLEIVAKASKSNVRDYVLPLLNKVAQSRFLEQHVNVGYLLRIPYEVHQHRVTAFIQSVEHLLDILEAILSTLPIFSNKCQAVLIILETIPQRLQNIPEETAAVLMCRIDALNERANDIHSKEVRENGSARRDKHQRRTVDLTCENEPPPDDFRQLSICPTLEDIHSNAKPYLRRNKESGGYDDHDHYLDVQFRLLREDYVRPLREGIDEYLKNLKSGRPDAKLQDMRVYRGVQIICPMCTPEGIAYRVQFDSTKLRQVRWQASKRLMYGSLLCLSNDDFRTLIFATVINREVKDLVDGFVDIRFVEDFAFDEQTGNRYVMAETTAYFEAYRHVLQGLQELDNDSVPFQRYIVSCQTEVRPPQYLRRDIPPAYDLSFCVKDDASRAAKLRAKAVSVLTTSRWPGTDTFCFDDSQLNAVKTALTKEFAIIQGPPGTGKTFVGLKIVRALLENSSAWGSHKPILIVCYTNHALDQFLEGMLDFGVTGLLRVGGRSTSDRLEKFKIRSIKQEMKKNKERRRDIMDLSRDCFNEMKVLESEIEDTSVKLELSARGILHEQALRNYMTEEQFESFGLEEEYTSGRKQAAMPMWLGLSVDIYGQGEVFGQSRLYALTPSHIQSLLFEMRMNEKNTFDIHEILEASQAELERNLTYAIAEDVMSVKHAFANLDRWTVYRQLHFRFETHQLFQLKALETDIKQTESRVISSTKSKRKKRQQRVGDENILRALELLKQREVEIKESLSGLRSTLGILRTSVLQEIMTLEEQIAIGCQTQDTDDMFFARWLGYGEVINILLRETAVEEDIGDEEAAEMIDAEEEAEMIAEHRMLEEEDEGVSLAKSLKQHRELATKIAANELSVNLDERHRGGQGGEWQVKTTSRRKLKQRVKQIIQSGNKMSATEANAVFNVWRLNVQDRCRLYMYWLSEYRNDLKTLIRGCSEKYDAVANRLKRVREDEDYHIMNEAKIIGMTTTGAAKFRAILQRLKPPIIVVEEAAEVLESHIITALNPSCEHLILIGDHKQLRPSPAVYELARHYNLELSLFERMVNNGVRCDTLELQHRMRPEIADLMQFIYPGLRDHQSVLELEDVKGVSSNVFFLDHQYQEVKHEENKSRSNKHEALFLAAFCRYLLLQGYQPSQITVLTTYSGQVFELKKTMPKKSFDGVRVTAVDNYQGEENDVILLSLVRSNEVGSIGFLNIENRVCVALSRAKRGLYVIGNFKLLAEKSPLWSKMVNLLKSKSCFGSEIELYCQNHPGVEKIRAKTDKDFASAPEGGCMRPCEARLACGHQCQKPCHVLDPHHRDYLCQKPCAKECSAGHRCKKLCYKECGKCSVRTKKIIPICGHEQEVPCHQDPYSFACQAKCKEILSCGHMCAEACGDPHTQICKEVTARIWPCGHVVKTACCNNHKNYPCPKPCTATLDCGHPCGGSCSKCLQGRLHQGCKQKCGRTLVCGHECRESCTKSCPPCVRPCENRCVHSHCKGKCGDACVTCREPCLWSCKHHQCTRLCGELCDRPPCDKPCKKRLPCGHRCIGLCGEECPALCLVCDKEKVCETFFGTEEDDGARFILLEDCKHVFEVSGLDYWMSCDSEANKTNVQLKGCPKCKVTIRKSLRYGNFIKKALGDVELAKSKIRGNPDEINLETSRLKKKLKQSLKNEHAISQISRRLEYPSLSLQQLNVLENQIILLENQDQLSAKLIGEHDKGHVGKNQMDEILDYLQMVSKVILSWFNFVSDQQLREAKFELQRLSYLFKARLYSRRLAEQSGALREKLSQKLERAILKLNGSQPFNSETEREMLELEATLKTVAPLGISESERLMVVQAMDLEQGHWFKCPNGHVYAIGECGGAMEESACPDCKAKIGGTSHKLLSDNRLAPEMDGARFAAWSDQANMNNYDMDDLV